MGVVRVRHHALDAGMPFQLLNGLRKISTVTACWQAIDKAARDVTHAYSAR